MAKRTRPWYETFFGRDYLKMYVHETTAAEIDAVERILHLRKSARILDIGCGAGRHTIELAKRGYRLTGYDLSEPLLEEARRAARREGVRPSLVHGDMRELRYAAVFDAAVSLFTSFGYFERPEDDRRVLAGVARALKPRGKFLMEMFNRDSLAASLPAQGWQVRDKSTVILEQDTFDSLQGRFETKRILIDGKGTREYSASVRAYTLAELKTMLDDQKLYVNRVLGGLDLSPYTPRSRRMVLLGVKGLVPETIRTMW